MDIVETQPNIIVKGNVEEPENDAEMDRVGSKEVIDKMIQQPLLTFF